MSNLMNLENNTLTPKQIEVLRLIPFAIQRTGSEITPENMALMAKDISSEFSTVDFNVIQSAMRNGALGKYGQTFKLTTQVVCIWVRSEMKLNGIVEKEIFNPKSMNL